MMEYYNENKQSSNKKYYGENKEKIKKQRANKKYYGENKEKISKQRKAYHRDYYKNKKNITNKRNYYLKNRTRIIQKQKKYGEIYYKINKEKILKKRKDKIYARRRLPTPEQSQLYFEKHKEQIFRHIKRYETIANNLIL